MAGLRSDGRKLSFDVLTPTDSFFDDDGGTFFNRSSSGLPIHNDEDVPATKINRRKRKKKKKKAGDEFGLNCGNRNSVEIKSTYSCAETMTTAVVYEEVIVPPEEDSVCTVISSVRETPELRQRNSSVANGGGELPKMFRIDEDKGSRYMSTSASTTDLDTELMMKQTAEMNMSGHGHVVRKLETDESLDWKRVIANADPNQKFYVETSPIKYLMEEMYDGNSLRTTTTLANEKERERVYDTLFQMPWRCELAIQNAFRSRPV